MVGEVGEVGVVIYVDDIHGITSMLHIWRFSGAQGVSPQTCASAYPVEKKCARLE